MANNWEKPRRSDIDKNIGVPARFRLIYESRDRKLCLFEDSRGHLTAVRASKLV